MYMLSFDNYSGGSTEGNFNTWAKDKSLAKDVIIHTHVFSEKDGATKAIVIVFFDEKYHPSWVPQKQ